VSREHSFSRRVVLLALVVVGIAVVALLAVRVPDWYRRSNHPLRHADLIAAESKTAGLDPYIVAALINVESGYRENVVSKAGAVGLMQIIPSTAHAVAADAGLPERVTAETLERPGTNVRVGTRYLAYLVKRYGSLELALAAYNAGMTNVDRWVDGARAKGTSFADAIEFPGTRYYVDEIEKQAATYRLLYPEAFAAPAE
jgi:soluble lytic murein transglycosylase